MVKKDMAREVEKEFSSWAADYGKIKFSFWEGDCSKQHLSDQRTAIRLLSPNKTWNVLDAGCGVGWGTIELALKVKPGVAYGIDITKEMIKKSEEHAKKLKVNNVVFRKASVLDLPFKDGFFNGCISTHAAHHFYKPVKMLSEIRRVLKPGSKFILVDTCASSKNIRAFEKKLKREEKAHYKFFRLSEARRLLERAGFKKSKGYRKNNVMYIIAVA